MHPNFDTFEELGRGADTVVFRGLDRQLDRAVAIKELDESARKNKRRLGTFISEARYLANVDHENVLKVYSVDDTLGWIVMELMEGTIAQRIDTNGMQASLVRSILSQMLQALDYLHSDSKIHGNVRPTNILIDQEGKVKISEFESTDVGSEMPVPEGCKKYLAPELLNSEKFGAAGPQLDLYCLGFSCFEMLLGTSKFEKMFEGTGPEALDSDIAWMRWHNSNDPYKSVAETCPSAPQDLTSLLDLMIQKNVNQRPGSAREALEKLENHSLVLVDVENEFQSAASIPDPVPVVSNQATAVDNNFGREFEKASTPPKVIQATTAGKQQKPLKDQINEILGKPYVLFPLCALILLVPLGWMFKDQIAALVMPPTEYRVSFKFDSIDEPVQMKFLQNGKPLTATAKGKFVVMPGKQDVKISADNMEPLSGSMTFDRDGVYGLSVNPKHRFVVSFANPEDTTEDLFVRVNGEEKVSLNEDFWLSPGDYSMELTKDGFVPVKLDKVNVGPKENPTKIDLKKFVDVVVQTADASQQIKIATIANEVELPIEKNANNTFRFTEGTHDIKVTAKRILFNVTNPVEINRDTKSIGPFESENLIPVKFNFVGNSDATKSPSVKVGDEELIQDEGSFWLTSGAKTFSFALEGYQADAKEIEVVEPLAPVDVVFKKLVNLTFRVSPPDAKSVVSISPIGKQLELSKQKTIVLPEGDYSLEVSAEDFVAQSRPWTVKRGQNVVEIKLRKKGALPEGLSKHPESTIDPDLNLPTRVVIDKFKDLGAAAEMVLVSPGQFNFGHTETARDKVMLNELKVRKVKISQPYYIGVTEVAVGAYKAYASSESVIGDWEKSGNRQLGPVRFVTQSDATNFCKWLSQEIRLSDSGWMNFQLPTEMQWEYAAKGGPNSPDRQWPWGNEFQSTDRWIEERICIGDSREQPAEVADAGFVRNPLGMFHVAGNISEICMGGSNEYEKGKGHLPLSGQSMIIRGSSYMDPVDQKSRLTYRHLEKHQPVGEIGFRIILPVHSTEE